MKVFELIEKLQQMPQDAEVVGYSHTDEGDHCIEAVEACLPSVEFKNGEISYLYPPYGCQADSYAEEIWLAKKMDIKSLLSTQQILLIMNIKERKTKYG